jgi:ParB family transcriptional regulator, chromosome partitioning protein
MFIKGPVMQIATVTTTALLSQLALNPKINARTPDPSDIVDIKASIMAKGWAGTMWVRAKDHDFDDRDSFFEIIDGSRRFFALTELLEEGLWKADTAIGITIFDVSDEEALEISLLSVETRRELTLTDQVSTFYRLKLSGMAEAEIAAHFAMSERLVAQRLALGGLAPSIFEALKLGKIDVQCAMAFTILKSNEAQAELFIELSKSGNKIWASHVKNVITHTRVVGTNLKCKFVGEADYEAAGGTITRDLFDTQVYFDDAALVQLLFDNKIRNTAEDLKAEGWAFVEILKAEQANKLHSWTTLPPKGELQLSTEDEAKLAASKIRLEQLNAEIEAAEQDEDSEMDFVPMYEEEEALEATISLLTTKPYTDKQIKKSGCVIVIGDERYQDSEVEIKRGMLKPSAAKKPNVTDDDELEAERQPAQAGPVIDAVDYTEVLSRILIDEARNATKLAMVQQKPMMAYRMGLASRLLDAVDRGHEAPFDGNHGHTGCGLKFNDLKAEAFNLQTKASFPELVAALELLEPDQIIQLEAYLAADQLDFSNLKSEDVRTVIDLIDPDMKAEGFVPDEAFLAKLSAKQVNLILAEIDPKAPPFKGKKPDLVAHALPQIELHGWMPQPLRTPSYKGPGSASWQEAIAQLLVEEAEAAREKAQQAAE